MSAICIFNLKECNCNFDELNHLSKDVVACALKNEVAVFFNCKDYMNDLIEDGQMCNYFLVSDSFLYRNCDFLSLDGNEYQKISNFEQYNHKYSFFEEIVKILFNYNITLVEVYVADEHVEKTRDFETKKSSVETLVIDLYNNIFSEIKQIGYFHPTKFVITK